MICDLGSRVVNNYLISFKTGYILIDTGYAGGFPHFMKMLKKNHIQPKEIRYIFLTHAHDDHAGFLNEVLAVTNAKVILHPKAVKGLKRGQNSFEGGCSSLRAWLFCQILALFGHGDHHYPAIRKEYIDRLISIDSEQFKALHFPYRILKTPGHTADHISLQVGDILFCGDAAMNGFPSKKRITIWIENLQEYQGSWKTIIWQDPRMIFPAHGKPFKTKDLQKNMEALSKVKLHLLRPSSGKGQ